MSRIVMNRGIRTLPLLAAVLFAGHVCTAAAETTFPGAEWETIEPEAAGMDAPKLTEFVEQAGSSVRAAGAIVRDGRMVAQWGEVSDIISWVSAWKPQNSMCLFFLVHEGLLESVHDSVAAYVPEAYPDKELIEKDSGMTFWHLANQVSGYSFPQRPGESFSYNDPATATAARLLSAVVQGTYPDENRVSYLRNKLAPIGLQDGLSSWMSVRDQCRLAWWWLNKGSWDGAALVASRFFDSYARPLVPRDLPHSTGEDSHGAYLSSEGSSTGYEAQGIYGFWWWFNNRPCLDTTLRGGRIEHFFEGLPNDAFAAHGYGNNYVIAMPRLNMVAAFNPYSGGGEGWSLLMEAVHDVDRTPPAVPGVPTAEAVSGGVVGLQWDAVGDPDGVVDAYWVYRDGAFLAEVSGDATGFVDETAETGSTHTYRLQSFNASGFADSLGPPTSVFVSPVQTVKGRGHVAARPGMAITTVKGEHLVVDGAGVQDIFLLDCRGRVVWKHSGEGKGLLSLGGLPSGVYHVLVRTSQGLRTFRFLR